MNSKFLVAVSMMSLMMPTFSFAEGYEKNETIKEDLIDAKDAVSDSAKEVYKKIKAALITEEDKADFNYITIDMNRTALGLLNKPIFNSKNEKIGILDDIIIDKKGRAQIVVVSHGGFLGIGDKNAAFDYNLVMRSESDGDIIIPVSKKTIETARIFSYNTGDSNDKIRAIPKNGISLKELMKANLIDNKGVVISGIENIYFRNGYAYQLIVGFDKTLGVGGQKALIDFNKLKLTRKNDEHHFQMSERQSLQFEKFKKLAGK